jgi:hypothetical protein
MAKSLIDQTGLVSLGTEVECQSSKLKCQMFWILGFDIYLTLGFWTLSLPLLSSSEAFPRQAAGHPEKDGGTLHSHQPSFAKASEGSPRHSSPWQATGHSGEGE